ncbi:saccharopine dehydrogenase NADP-binding domain-containing protein [Butyrivibrio sp. XPD2002]|uniref:saccharopine dehydrogenase NADP-binding domain-containing protein n=1 Tax=Butyrivibrio sp. XPD2002 TaxID=1280665 RepID=UPI00040DB85B|nr:saccharopine dehydrogenase NADP-binding domain-containing protein [Butyrivibrio sp. XPD2002]
MASKIMFLGLGVVPQSLMDLLLKDKMFSIDDMIVVDESKNALDFFRSRGGKEENLLQITVGEANYLKVFDYLGSGDFLINLLNGLDAVVMTGECVKRGIHFMCAADGWFPGPDPVELAYEDHFQEIREISKANPNGATTIENFGVNSGMINILTKKALIDIVEEDDTPFVKENREYLRELVKKNEFGMLAKELQVKYFVESDLDTTQTNITDIKPGTVYSTWNPFDFYGEMNDRATVIVGTGTKLSEMLARIGSNVDEIHSFDPDARILDLNRPGKRTLVKAVVEDQIIEGCLDDHEEMHSMRDYFSVWNEKGDLEYAPSLMFVYQPCELAYKTVFIDKDEAYYVISKDEMVAGGEYIGMLIEGDNFHPRYIGTKLLLEDECFGTPTAALVGISIYAAIKYIIKHPNEGVVYPEELEADEMISYIKPYMPVVSIQDCSSILSKM